ncbi:MAG: hypothetical protein AMXMBFR84_32660 [Candidatus Hydrogenedentota bacterium]
MTSVWIRRLHQVLSIWILCAVLLAATLKLYFGDTLDDTIFPMLYGMTGFCLPVYLLLWASIAGIASSWRKYLIVGLWLILHALVGFAFVFK